MAQVQLHQPSMMYIGGASPYDIGALEFDDIYVITSDKDNTKWYLRLFDPRTNQCAWTKIYSKAMDFDTEEDAIEYAKCIGRNFVIEKHDGWIF